MIAVPLLLAATPAGPPPRAVLGDPIEQVTIAPLFHRPFTCMEHPVGQLKSVGDALGTDCLAVGATAVTQSTGFFADYRGDGSRNEDWYGWRAELFAPFDGVVTKVTINPVTNTPGTMGKPPASEIDFRRADGVTVLYAHIMEPRVTVGDHVTAGQLVAIDGNNGPARTPHVHVGAFRGLTPLQIRWDLAAMGKVPALAGD